MAVWISPNVFSGFFFLISLRISSAKKKYADFGGFGAFESDFFFGFLLGMAVLESSDDLTECVREESASEESDWDESDDFFVCCSSSESLDEEDEPSVSDEEEFDEPLLLPCSLCCVMVLW